MDANRINEFVNKVWDDSIVPSLEDYIRIPCKSPMFDADWVENGYMEEAVELIRSWCAEQPIEGLTVEVVRLDGRTPLIYIEVAGTGDSTVLMYGHLDKQPEMVGWEDDLGPWKPVIRDGKLYGRGGADDGYAAFASLTSISALQDQGIPHSRCVILIEACEESGSYDLPPYLEMLADRIGTPDLIVCLDSGCGNYDQLWCTTSLRGMVSGDLKIRVIENGVHSGDASGIVPSSFRVLRSLLDRVDAVDSGAVKPEFLHVEIPEARIQQAEIAADALGDAAWSRFPFVGSTQPMAKGSEAVLNRTWRPALSITGVGGIPPIADAGNVLRPETTVKLSLRLAPTTDPDRATTALKELLESDPPCGAEVVFDAEPGAAGWDAPALAPWLEASLGRASQAAFGKDTIFLGEGGSIPLMGLLGEMFPEAQFVITGVLGPEANAHGPNEFLHIGMGKGLTSCVSHVLADHCAR